jgi:hypothetical protein
MGHLNAHCVKFPAFLRWRPAEVGSMAQHAEKVATTSREVLALRMKEHCHSNTTTGEE